MSKRIDLLLGATGLALAAGAVWFPWHVYLTPENFGPPRMTFERVGPSVQDTLDAHMNAFDDMLRGMPVVSLPPRPGVDLTVTGSITGKHPNRALPLPDLVMAANGRALMKMDGRLDLWRVGSRTEDGRRVVSIGPEEGYMLVRLDDGTAIRAVSRTSR